MLYEFLKTNRNELIARCRTKAARRTPLNQPVAESESGIPQFLTQLIETFRVEQTPEALARRKAAGHCRPSLSLVPAEIASSAADHGNHLRLQGVSIDRVVHGYGDLCQALTELAIEKSAPITVDEFHTFNRCLDDAIADAVTAYSGGLHVPASRPQVQASSVGPGSPVEQMHALIEKAMYSFSAIKRGDVGLSGTTSMLHEQSLGTLHDLIDRALVGERTSVDRADPAGAASHSETPGIKKRLP